MRKISAFVILLILGCSSKSSMLTYLGDEFSIAYPKEWTVNNKVDNALVRISAPEELASSTLAPAITVSNGRNTESGINLTDRSIFQLKESIADFNLISKDTVKAGGRDCDRLIFSGNLASSRTIWSLVIFDGAKDDYFISCTAPFDLYEANSRIFTDVQKSFKIE